MNRIRCKFRCMSNARTWDLLHVIKLQPVKRDKGRDPENESFAKYTPGGDIELTYRGEAPKFDPGAYYYVDLIEAAPDLPESWVVNEVADRSHREPGKPELIPNGEVKLYFYARRNEGLTNASMRLNIDKSEAFNMLAKPGSGWLVEFRFAEASDYQPPQIAS